MQVDLGVNQRIDTVRLHPRGDAGNAGYGFPVAFEILVSSDGIAWVSAACVGDQLLPSGPQSYAFAPRQARYVRVAATVLRSNPNDSGRFALQFAEIEVLGPASRFTVESSMNLPDGFADEAFAFVDLDSKQVSVPMTCTQGFFRLRGDPPPLISATTLAGNNFIITFD